MQPKLWVERRGTVSCSAIMTAGTWQNDKMQYRMKSQGLAWIWNTQSAAMLHSCHIGHGARLMALDRTLQQMRNEARM